MRICRMSAYKYLGTCIVLVYYSDVVTSEVYASYQLYRPGQCVGEALVKLVCQGC